MLYGNVSVADEPGFVVVTQLVKENREEYIWIGRSKIEGRIATSK